MIPGYVYVFRAGNLLKIGRSNNPKRRAREVAVQVAEPVSCVFAGFYSDTATAERRMHELFGHRRVFGEWFELYEDEAADACSLLAGGEIYV